MADDVKGYVVRGKNRQGQAVTCCTEDGASVRKVPQFIDPVFSSLDVANAARAAMLRRGWSLDVAIFRVHADGREERLPSYEEALAEIERLRAVESINVNKIEASLTKLGETVGFIGRMPEHDPRCLVHDGVGCSFEAGCEPARALMASKPTVADGEEWECAKCHTRYGDEHEGWCSRKAQAGIADPLATLEAAERRLLEAEGWTYVGLHGGEQWEHAKHGREGRMTALAIARQSAKKGGS